MSLLQVIVSPGQNVDSSGDTLEIDVEGDISSISSSDPVKLDREVEHLKLHSDVSQVLVLLISLSFNSFLFCNVVLLLVVM